MPVPCLRFVTCWKSVEVVIYIWPSANAPAKLSTSASPLKTPYDHAKQAVHVVLPDVAGASELKVSGR